jgi:hypothetical protein
MSRAQAPSSALEEAGFTLRTERLGPLPLINHFIERIGLHETLSRFVPSDQRCAITHASALGVLVRSIIVEREPIYRQQETVHGFADGMFGIDAREMALLSDDRLGRALDRLFDADRTALLTELVLAVGQRFGVRFDEFHNDSTTISFCGSYRAAGGRRIRGRSAAAVTYGMSKAHRPDLKQLLFILTMSADGNVPVAFRCTDGNASDSRTHIETWNTLRAVAGRSDFLYCADSKLCSRENMDHIDRAGGRFVTVMPRSRLEDAQFREWIQTHTPDWTLVWERPNPRYSDGPRDCWYVHRAPLPSMEAWSIVWVWSSLLTLRQHARRLRNIAALSRSSSTCASAWRPPRPACAAPPRSTCKSSSSWTNTTSPATSRCAASCARSTSSSRRAAAALVRIPPTENSPSGASMCSGTPTRTPSPMTAGAMACTPS